MKKQRNSSIELLRIISIVGIVLMHTYALIDRENASTFNYYFGYFINAIFNIGVTCFVLISGYFGIKFKLNRFIEIIILTTVYSILTSLFVNGFHLISIAKSSLTVPLYSLWFIACYLLLMLLSPYIEVLVKIINVRDFRKLLIILFITLSFIPTFFDVAANSSIVHSGGKCFTYFLFIYLIGRYIHLYKDQNYSSIKLWGIHILMVICMISLNIIVGLIFKKRCVIFSWDCSPFILISAISVFYLFKSYHYTSKFINTIAKSVLAIYIMNGIYRFFDREFFHLSESSNDYLFVYKLLGCVCLSCFFALLIDLFRIYLTSLFKRSDK